MQAQTQNIPMDQSFFRPRHPVGAVGRHTQTSRAAPTARFAASLLLAALLSGCASGGSAPDTGLFDRALQAVGLSKPPLPELPQGDLPGLPRKVSLRLHAGAKLNTDPFEESLTLVTRVYKLKDSAAFLDATYASLQAATPAREAAFAQDIIEMREVVLTAGTRNEVIEIMPPQAKYLAVVALYRKPAPDRWRFVFETKAAAASGVTLGLHACAMSVAQGQALDASQELQRLAGVECEKKPRPDKSN
jgi:type VI secretion system protein VasD